MNNDKRAPSESVVFAVASFHNTDPTVLTPPLGECIDTDALNRLLESPDVNVEFAYCGLRLRVSSDSDVSIIGEVEQ